MKLIYSELRVHRRATKLILHLWAVYKYWMIHNGILVVYIHPLSMVKVVRHY